MFNLPDFIIAVYVLVDELLKAELQGEKLRQRGKAPQFSDAEVLCVEVVGEFLGYHEDKALWEYFHRHWRHFFPRLPSRSRLVRQAADLWHVKQRLHTRLAHLLAAFVATVHVVDSFPMRVCRWGRAPRCKLFKGDASVGYCASQKERYYGLKGHLLISDEGVITACSLTPANVHDRTALEDLLENIVGVL